MKQSKILLLIFFCSFSSLAYEVVLTRIFSISLSYHFAFMMVSIAMLGIGASGTILSLFPKLKNPGYVGAYSLLLGVGISASYLLSNQIPFDPIKLSWSGGELFYIGLYYLVLAVPFFSAGLVITTAFSSFSEKSGLLYGADLLGAGMGSIGVLGLMILTGPERVVFIVSSAVGFVTLVVGGKGLKAVSSIFISANLLMLIFQPQFSVLRISPFKDLQVALRYPGAEHLKTCYSPFSRIDLFESPAVRFAPGLSLKYLDPLPDQIGFSIDGGQMNAVTSPQDQKKMAFLKYLPSALPYELGRLEDVLVLDPKGGLQVLLAEYYGAKKVFKVESTPSLIRVIQENLVPFTGDIYSRNTYSELGRSWLSSDQKKFDLIDISLMGATPSGFFGIAEDYRYTVEAFRQYLGHLKPGGFLSVNLFILPPPRVELRLLNTIIKAMGEMGIKDVREHIAAIRSWGSLCILGKRSAFSPAEISSIQEFSKDRRFDLIYYPGVREEETNVYVRTASNEHFHAFSNLLNPGTRKEFSDKYLFDIGPVRDEDPFFHYYLRLRNLKAIYKAMGEKWQYFIEEGYLLPAVFLQVLLLSLVIMVLPLVAKKRQASRSHQKESSSSVSRLRNLSCFAFIGLGFMFVEVSLIQKMILLLENPSYAVAIVLTSVLISSGIGSLLSYRILALRKPPITVLLSLFIVLYSLLLPYFSESSASYPMPSKIILVFLLLVPLGLLMGIPFPAALRTLGEEAESLIPWAWAINGCFSVLAPLLTIMLAMAVGFQFVLWVGAGCYLLAYLTLRNRVTSSSPPPRSWERTQQIPSVQRSALLSPLLRGSGSDKRGYWQVGESGVLPPSAA